MFVRRRLGLVTLVHPSLPSSSSFNPEYGVEMLLGLADGSLRWESAWRNDTRHLVDLRRWLALGSFSFLSSWHLQVLWSLAFVQAKRLWLHEKERNDRCDWTGSYWLAPSWQRSWQVLSTICPHLLAFLPCFVGAMISCWCS